MIMALRIKTSIVFSLVLASNTNLSYFFHFFLIMDLHFLIRAVIVQILNPSAELAILTETPANKANAEMIRHLVMVEMKRILGVICY